MKTYLEVVGKTTPPGGTAQKKAVAAAEKLEKEAKKFMKNADVVGSMIIRVFDNEDKSKIEIANSDMVNAIENYIDIIS